jgi:septal ring factor EnvC (AmiA/AmiB activator)
MSNHICQTIRRPSRIIDSSRRPHESHTPNRWNACAVFNHNRRKLKVQSSTVKKDGTRVQISDDKRQDLQKQIEEQEKKAKELQEKLKEEQENVKRFNVFFGDPATRRLQDSVDDSDKKLRLK